MILYDMILYYIIYISTGSPTWHAEVLWLCLQGEEQGHRPRARREDNRQGGEQGLDVILLFPQEPQKNVEK